MNQATRNTILFFIIGASLCIFPLFALPWLETSGIRVDVASELLPTIAKVDQNQTLQLQMPIYLIRQQFIPYISSIQLIYTYFFMAFAILGLGMILWGIKKWATISSKQFVLGLAVWGFILLYKLLALPSQEILLTLSQWILPLSFLAIFALSVLSSQTIPLLILQMGRRTSITKTKRTYTFLYLLLLIDLAASFYLQEGGDAQQPTSMLIYLVVYWGLFYFQILSNPVLREQKTVYVGLLLISLSSIWWFLLHLNDPALRFAFEWLQRCTLIMALLFPAFIYSNFKEIFTQNLPLHLVVFKAHRLKLYLYQIGVLILGLGWVFAKNASLYHIFLAGFYNQTGDMETFAGKPQLAKISYLTAQANSRLNYKSNLELAKLSENDEEKAQYLSYTLNKFNNPITYLSLGSIYKNNDHPFQALFTFQEGLEKYPDSHVLATALAIQYEKLNQPNEALSAYKKAHELAPKNASTFANLLYAQANLFKSKSNIPVGFENDLAAQSNRMALWMLQGKTVNAQVEKDFKMANDVPHFAYLYNLYVLNKSKSTLVDFGSLLKNETLAGTFPELKLLDAWNDFYGDKRLRALQKISFLKENYAGSEENPYESIFYFWHQTLNEATAINAQAECKVTLEKYPFSLAAQAHCFPKLNAQKQEKLAYDYALAAIQFNPNRAELYPNYIIQALKISETSYAKEAMQTLKKLDPKRYASNEPAFKKELERVVAKRVF